ncbi:protein-L-isoaspartate(D-aspartate) O-methyltransferase [Marinobacter sp. NP-4(2019)]|uniref:protein-L-isoaspartate(D-aspartate) O-methyltransferase n=1 Tax=Marinobacter sp. NP-4(2019) TaxID=2488665 RepID=UPI000FC3DC3C|nr:protein-L-isoaspartate(D-aspartate) O-methyltransferase [Marinobacter sp. NP-4(2019)]AZT84809.1 protein-L-isoaspartate(D-aspartate) O-methyltransferase [Marinobacter sp. NP-4(2019)]
MSRSVYALILMWLGACVALSQAPLALADPDRQAERQALVQSLRGVAPDLMIDDPNVRAAMLRVPRHRFVPDGLQDEAYLDKPVPIGHGQTISQPTVVALMTQLADVDATHKVLEVGTGSGYQAAILAQLTDQVYTIEIIEPLARDAQQRLANLGYNRIRTRQGDGYYGWPEQAPFDRILVTAAAAHIPPPLLQQLKPDGRMVIPVGPRWGAQTLMLVTKDQTGETTTESLLPVRFVPLTSNSLR